MGSAKAVPLSATARCCGAARGGKLPGHVFTAPDGEEVTVEVTVQFSSQDAVRAVEIMKDGQVERTVPTEEATRSGSLGSIRFKESGWFAVRAIVDHSKTFRFAHTAPYYVEIGRNKHRVSKASAQFFRDWTLERSAQLSRIGNASQRQEVLEQVKQAKNFWTQRVAEANAP